MSANKDNENADKFSSASRLARAYLGLPETLYHYCKTDSFVSIINSGAIWLSSLSLSNDYMEGKLLNRTLKRSIEHDESSRNIASHLLDAMNVLERGIDTLGFCLSAKDDLLSQWRGYADDGQGMAIGFSMQYLEKLSQNRVEKDLPGFYIKKVLYTQDDHEKAIKPTFDKLREIIDAGKLKNLVKTGGIAALSMSAEEIEKEDQLFKEAHSILFHQLIQFSPSLFELKGEAFEEEQEWRLLSTLFRPSDFCLYRSTQNRVIPFREFELINLDTPILTDIVLGPKHQTPEDVIKMMLKNKGLGNVVVRKSKATYR